MLCKELRPPLSVIFDYVRVRVPGALYLRLSYSVPDQRMLILRVHCKGSGHVYCALHFYNLSPCPNPKNLLQAFEEKEPRTPHVKLWKSRLENSGMWSTVADFQDHGKCCSVGSGLGFKLWVVPSSWNWVS